MILNAPLSMGPLHGHGPMARPPLFPIFPDRLLPPDPMTPKRIVEAYLQAFYREYKDFDALENLLAESFKFRGPMATFEGRAAFMAFIQEIGPQQNHIEIRGILAEGNQVAVFHDFHSRTPVIGPLPFAEWYILEEDRIVSLELFFDAREFAALIAGVG